MTSIYILVNLVKTERFHTASGTPCLFYSELSFLLNCQCRGSVFPQMTQFEIEVYVKAYLTSWINGNVLVT